MAGLFSRLGTGNVLKDLRATQSALEKLNLDYLNAQPDVGGLIDQIIDLTDIIRSFQHLATAERQGPSVFLKFGPASDLLHLQSVVDNTAAIIEDCAAFINVLQSTVERVARRREVTYLTDESQLASQGICYETGQILRLWTEVLRALFTAIDMLQCRHDVNVGGQSPESPSSASTQLHFQIELAERTIGSVDQRHNTRTVGFS